MKSLIMATVMVMLTGVMTVGGDEGNYDLERIVTVDGARFYDISILEADQHGMMFRHRHGIAKVDHKRLPANLRMLYQPLGESDLEPIDDDMIPDVPDIYGRDAGKDQDASRALSSSSSLVNHSETMPLVPHWLLTIRFHYPTRAEVRGCDHSCHPVWSGVHGMSLCHQGLLIQDFLYTSGLVRKPVGMHTYRVPLHWNGPISAYY